MRAEKCLEVGPLDHNLGGYPESTTSRNHLQDGRHVTVMITAIVAADRNVVQEQSFLVEGQAAHLELEAHAV